MTAKKGIGFIVATKGDRPFAVLIIRGGERVSQFDAIELLEPPAPAAPGENPDRPVFQAVNYALSQLGLDPRQLQAEGWAEPDIQVAPIGEDLSYAELRARWRESIGLREASEATTPEINVRGTGDA